MLRTFILAIGLLLFSSLAVGQSIEKARLLRTNKMFDDAKREAVAVVFSDASDNEKASALKKPQATARADALRARAA